MENEVEDDAAPVDARQFDSLAEIAPVGLYRADTQGRCLYVNSAWCRIAGMTPEEAAGNGWLKVIDPRDRERTTAEWREAVAQARAYRTELRFRLADGTVRRVETHAEPEHDDDGKFVGYVGVTTDITEQRRAAERLGHVQRLQSLGVLAGGLAHDFNNLLVGILGNAGLALLDLPPESPARPCMREVERTAQRAAELCRELLNYAGQGRMSMTPTDLSTFLGELAPGLRKLVPPHVELKLDLPAKLAPIAMDATHIEQALIHLTRNAADAIGDQRGTITLSLRKSRHDDERFVDARLSRELHPGEYVCLAVSDTGCGMDDETLARIFEPFFSTKFPGRGLGLAATFGIVHSHCGAIEVESAPGAGTTVRICLPVHGSAGG